jgi:hypothetical protein
MSTTLLEDTLKFQTANHIYLGVLLLAACARNSGILTTPEILGSFGEGLGFSDDVVHNYQGDVAEIAATDSCIQLLCAASLLVHN